MRYLFFVNILFFFSVNALFAQNNNGELPGGEVEVVKTFEANLAETERVQVKPALPPADDSVKSQNYDNLPIRTLGVNYPAPSIRPMAMRREKLSEAYDGYIKLGAGLPTAFNGEFGYGKQFNKNLDLSFAADFLTMSNNKKVDNQKMRDLGVSLDAAYSLNNGLAVGGHLGFSSDKTHYFAYNQLEEYKDTIIANDEVKQRFNLFEVGVKLFNDKQNVGDINYSAGIDLYNLKDLYATNELGFDLKFQAKKYFAERHPVELELRTDFTNYQDTTKQSLNNFYLTPTFTFVGDAFKIKAGVRIANSDDIYHFFPNAEALVSVLGSTLSVFAGIDGSLEKQNFRSLTSYNPYVKSRIQLANNKWRDIYGGVKGAVSIFEYRGEIGYKSMDNLAMYLPVFDVRARPYIQRFEVLRDTANIVHIGGTLSAKPLKDLEVRGTITQNIYNLKKEAKPWHLPVLELNSTIVYTVLDGQARIKAELFIENGVPVKTETGKTDNLNGLLDLSLGAEYFFTKQIGAYLQVNNIANNRRQRWQNYPTFGLNALVGVSAKF